MAASRVEDLELNLSAEGYEAFHIRSCIRRDFTAIYFTLGLVEEASEVLEACQLKSPLEEIIEESAWWIPIFSSHGF